MRTLFIATGNPGKLKEMIPFARELFAHQKPEIQGVSPPLEEETGDTFQANALLKAQSLFDALVARGEKDFAVLADDSGICVDALGGRPGIYSARYAGGHVDAREHMEKLLRELGAVTHDPSKRTARYHCALALLIHHPDLTMEFLAEGTCEGVIAESSSGSSGFGYDPIFIVPPFNQTFGNIPYETKNKISHRTRAFAELRRLIGMRGL